MKNYQISRIILSTLFHLLILFQVGNAQNNFEFKENLHVENVKDNTKNLYAFDFQFKFGIDFETLDSEIHSFSRSVLESLFVSANTQHTRVEAACGTINSVYLEEKHIAENYFFPSNGMKLFADANGTNYQVLLQALAEIFKLTKFSVLNANHFRVKNPFSDSVSQQEKSRNLFAQDYWFAQDPTDFICTNNIEKLKKYFPCGGRKGLISIIDQSKLFKADYISITSDLKHIKSEKTVEISIQIQAIVPKIDFQEFFTLENVQTCPLTTSSQVQIDSEKRLQQKQLKAQINLTEIIEPITLDNQRREMNFEIQEKQKYTSPLTSERYMGDRWFDFNGHLVHEIRNNDAGKRTVQLTSTEYLIWQFQPVLHQISVTKTKQNVQKHINPLEIKYDLEIQDSQFYKFQFHFELEAGETLRLVIPINKLMKSFENYPHDPQRGHDMISGSVVYRFGKNESVKQLASKNLILRLPEPDFSMPFNIITYVCVLLGYVFLTYFLNSTSKPK